MTRQEIEKGYGICGLVCGLCSYRNVCPGCREKTEDCEVKKCCLEKGLGHCFECEEYPCDKKLYGGVRSRAFNQVAREEGLERLAGYLYRNWKNGMKYHKEDGTTGDYDSCQTVEEVISLLKNGKPKA